MTPPLRSPAARHESATPAGLPGFARLFSPRFAPRCARPFAAVVVAVFAVSSVAGCASRRAGGDSQSDSPSASREPCDPIVGAAIGGLAGALLGGKGDKNRAAGAAIGAGIGALACAAFNYHARQTRSAEQVGNDYRARNNDTLPAAPLVTAYRTEAGSASANPGDDITITSNIEVVPGRTEPLRELREEFQIMDPDGKERSRLSKTPAPSGSSGGAYVSTLQFTFPKGVPAGAYQVQTQLYVNGQPARSSAVRIQVAGGTALRLAAASIPERP